MISSAIWNYQARVNFSKTTKICSLNKFASAHLFQISREKRCDYLLIIYMKRFEMVKQKKRTRIAQFREKLHNKLHHPGRALDLI